MALFSPSNSISTLRSTVAVGRSACGGRGRPWGFRRRHGLPHRIPRQKHNPGRSKCPSTERACKELQNAGKNKQFHRTVAEISSDEFFASGTIRPEMSKGGPVSRRESMLRGSPHTDFLKNYARTPHRGPYRWKERPKSFTTPCRTPKSVRSSPRTGPFRSVLSLGSKERGRRLTAEQVRPLESETGSIRAVWDGSCTDFDDFFCCTG